MFVRGLRGRLGDYVNRSWSVENWWTPAGAGAGQIVPGVSNTTALVGGGLGLAAAAALAWWLLKK